MSNIDELSFLKDFLELLRCDEYVFTRFAAIEQFRTKLIEIIAKRIVEVNKERSNIED